MDKMAAFRGQGLGAHLALASLLRPGINTSHKATVEEWEQLAALAQAQGLAGAVAASLAARQYHNCPALISQQLHQNRILDTKHNMAAICQIEELCRALNQADIAPMLLKGAALLMGHPAMDPGVRSQSDIDILVHEEQLETTAERLLDMGYVFYSPGRAKRGLKAELHDLREALGENRRHHHILPMIRPGHRMPVEIHRRALPGKVESGLDPHRLAQRAVGIVSEGANYLLPAAQDQAAILVLGNVINDGFLARSDYPMRAGRDVLHLADSFPDGELLNDYTRALGRTDVSLFTELTRFFFGIQKPETLRPASQRYLRRLAKRTTSHHWKSAYNTIARGRHLVGRTFEILGNASSDGVKQKRSNRHTSRSVQAPP